MAGTNAPEAVRYLPFLPVSYWLPPLSLQAAPATAAADPEAPSQQAEAGGGEAPTAASATKSASSSPLVDYFAGWEGASDVLGEP